MTGARVMPPPDPVAGLIAQYHEAVATINGFPVRDGVNGDAECSRFCDEVFDPLRDRIATTRPTTRAGLFALLDLAVKEFGHDQSPMMPGLIENARDAVKEAAPGVMVPLVEDPILDLIAALERARAVMRSQEGRERPEEGDSADLNAATSAANRAELDLIAGEPRTPAGFVAKVAYLSRVRVEVEGTSEYPDQLEAAQKHGRMSVEAIVAAFARDAAALYDGSVAPCPTSGL